MKTYDQMCLETIQLQLVSLQTFLLECEMHNIGLIDNESHKANVNAISKQFESFVQRMEWSDTVGLK